MHERVARHYAASREGLQRLTQVTVLVLISAMLAMAGMIWQRRPAIAALTLHGYPEDFPVFYSTAGLDAFGILLLITVVAVAMIALPGWLAVRVPPKPGGAT